MSQPTTCFGLFCLSHLQVEYTLVRGKIYNSAIQPLKSGGGRDLVYKNGACAQAIGINICIVYISPWNIFVHYWRVSVVVLHYCTFFL